MTFGGLACCGLMPSGGGGGGGQATAVVLLGGVTDITDSSGVGGGGGGGGGAGGDGDVCFVVADGAAGLLVWALPRKPSSRPTPEEDGEEQEKKEKEALGLDSRQAVRITLPEGRHALCVSVRPGAQQRPLVACGSDDGTVVLLSFRQRSAVTEGAGASSSSVAADVVRVLRVAGGEEGITGSGTVVWSADGRWLWRRSAMG